jgi:hypothetical protein
VKNSAPLNARTLSSQVEMHEIVGAELFALWGQNFRLKSETFGILTSFRLATAPFFPPPFLPILTFLIGESFRFRTSMFLDLSRQFISTIYCFLLH